MKRLLAAAMLLFCAQLFAQDFESDGLDCTSIAVGRLASDDGSVITSHTCDGKSRTWLTIEPAARFPKGAMHPVYRGGRHNAFPGDTSGVRCTGELPEARRTYAYLNTAYPSLNEKQLAIGETTFSGPDTLRSDNGIFLVEELCRIALQRCDNAREAVALMGSLAEEYGYIDGGECLTVADKNEVWFFEILGPGKGEKGAVWAAQRVPDGEVAVSANIPRISRIDRSDRKNFLSSANVESVARRYALWDGEGEFIFYKAYHGKFGDGKNFREREWWIMSTLAPSLGLKFEDDEMPFSVKPEKPVSVREVMQLLRSTYEGVEGFDMTQNIKMNGKISPIANPWPTTNYQKTINELAPGSITFRRTVSVAWCAYSTVIQLRNYLPDAVGGICWLAVDNPAQSPHIPIFAGNTELPDAMSACGQNRYDPSLFVWQFRKANKLATLSWQSTKEDFNKTLREVEDGAFSDLPGRKASSEELNAYTKKVYEASAARWAELEARYWVQFGRGF